MAPPSTLAPSYLSSVPYIGNRQLLGGGSIFSARSNTELLETIDDASSSGSENDIQEHAVLAFPLVDLLL
ncbi:hypothetical protein L917_01191 [Phytophthora nicotianae]|uniref:Uncharacterized protein n=2 Tax=Phytophthora nicotianae TaxID=4792 RepID=V9FZ84_PHYNI|nr:hypothetical protein F443_01307 [Phytophthora nicotianae P1569]ETM02327.1 hypothetical protein L917_01191 [Phytophthora nicotianae]